MTGKEGGKSESAAGSRAAEASGGCCLAHMRISQGAVWVEMSKEEGSVA